MEVAADIVMEDGIVGSTELGIDQTVNPSVLGIHDPMGPASQVAVVSRGFSPAHASPFNYVSPSDESMRSEDSESDMRTATPTYKTYPQVEIPPPSRSKHLPYSSKRSGLVYDVRMRFHTEYPDAMEEAGLGADLHPEDPRRIYEIYQALVGAGLVQDDQNPDPDPEFQLFRISARPASRTEICLVHHRAHYRAALKYRDMSEAQLVALGKQMDSIYLHKLTFECATLAAGGTIEACRAVVAGHVKNAIAVVRPPGHHAEPPTASGFCIFNNVAIAAKVCQRDFPKQCRKVLILDWDVHHGNGIQMAFENDPNVLYISLHVYLNGTFYPQGTYGDHLHCGEGAGLGYNVNIPWAYTGMGDGDYMFAFQQVVMPIAQEFDPDLVLIAAGFDAAEGDTLGGCHVTPPCYAHMTHMLMSLAKGKIAVVLEGGYNLSSISKSALAVTRTLMGEPPDRLPVAEPKPSALGVSTVHLVQRTQARFWKCMYPKPVKRPSMDVPSDRLHDIVREWQSLKLLKEFSMSPLMIHRTRISKSFNEEVLATPNFDDNVPLLVIFHDPPDAQTVRDQSTGRIEMHNTFLTDVTKSYIEWAVTNKFAVIDVNVPRHITDPDDDVNFEDPDSREQRLAGLREVSTYLWENYVSLGSASHIFFLGIGEAYAGVLDLLSSHEGCEERINKVISFVCDSSLQSVKRPTDDNIAGWYYRHSLVYVAGDHPAWDPDRMRKVRKKFGYLQQSPQTALVDMLLEHRDVVFQVLANETAEWRAGVEEEERLVQERLDRQAAAAHPSGSSAGGKSVLSSRTATPQQVSARLEDRPGNGTGTPGPGQGPYNSALRSPSKMPPMGFFSSTSPARRDRREGTGTPRP